MDRAAKSLRLLLACDDTIADGLAACYNRLTPADQHRFWKLETQTDKLIMLAGCGGSQQQPAARLIVCRETREEVYA